MTVTHVWVKSDILPVLAAVWSAVEPTDPYAQGQRRGIELAALALGINPEALSLCEPEEIRPPHIIIERIP